MSSTKITIHKNSPGSLCCQLRVARNLSQTELGQRCGLTLRQISRFERTGQGKLKNVRKIAAVLGVTVDALVRNLVETEPCKKVDFGDIPEDFRITGVEFYRRLRRMSKKELSEISGVSLEAIDAWSKDEAAMENAYVSRLLKLSDVLGVTMELLCMVYPSYYLRAGDRPVRGSTKECPTNCITIYRRCKNLKFEDLAWRMGLTTREAARMNCVRKEPRERYIRELAKYERITPAEFMVLYAPVGCM